MNVESEFARLAHWLVCCEGNEGEAGLVVRHVSRLVAAGVRPADIAVITPYNLQVSFD